MTLYLNTETNEYPRHDGDLELLGWTLADPLPEKWVVVEYTNPPIVDVNTTYQQEFPTLADGVWRVSWATRPLTEYELLRRDTTYPVDDKKYEWDEASLSWIKI
jgi:hypothetical protein